MDLLFEADGLLQPVEMKSGQTITGDLVQAATAFSRRIGEPGHKSWLVYGGDEHQERSNLEVIGWRGFGARMLGRAN